MPEPSSPYAVSQSGMSPAMPPSQIPGAPSSAPKVFGILHICYALLGGLASFAGVASMMMLRFLAEKGGKEFKEMKPIVDAYDGMATFMYVDMALKLALALILLIAGIGILKRKVWSIQLSMTWAISRILIAIGMLIWGWQVTAAYQAQLPQAGGAQQEKIQQALQGAGNLFGMIILLVYPVVTIIFMSKKSFKDAMHQG